MHFQDKRSNLGSALVVDIEANRENRRGNKQK